MKYIYATLLIMALTTTTGNAQFAFEGGLNMATMSIKSQDKSVATTYKPGANFGFVGDMALDDNQHIFFQAGLFYKMAGTKLTEKPEAYYQISTIDIPLGFEYKSGTKCSSRFMFGAAVNTSVQQSGTYHREADGVIDPITYTLKFDGEKGNFVKRSYGLNLNVGYKLKNHIYFRAAYLMGFNNLVAEGDSKNSVTESAFSLNIGWVFSNCHGRGGSSWVRSSGRSNWRGMSKRVYSRKHNPPRYNPHQYDH